VVASGRSAGGDNAAVAKPTESARLRRLLVRVVVGALVATAAAAVAALLAGDFGDTQLRIVLTTGAVSAYGLLALPAGFLLERRRLAALAQANLLAVGLAFALVLYLIWAEWDDAGETAWKSVAVATTAAGVLAQASAALSRRQEDDTPAIRRLTVASVVAAAVLGAMIVVALLAEVDRVGYYRALGAVAVVDVLLLVLPPVLRRGRPAPAATAGRVRLVVEVDAGTAAAVEREVESHGGRVVGREQA
jgi:hypothetical protein